jgi:ferredoxin
MARLPTEPRVDPTPAYLDLQKRLDRNPIGMPKHRALFEILAELYTPEEARVASVMPLRIATAGKVAKLAGLDVVRAQGLLDGMVAKALVVDLARPDGRVLYYLNPAIIGFFEFTMMRVRDDIDQATVARRMWEYLAEDPEQAFARMLFEGTTFIARPLVHEDVLPPDHTEILDWERATAIIQGAKSWGEGICHCRHVQKHLGRPCVHPIDLCMSLGMAAEYLIRNGSARRIDKARALAILEESRERGLVQMGDNVKNRPTYICNCCGCCCEMLHGIRSVKQREAVITSGWVAHPAEDACNGCNKCVKACPVEALSLVPAAGIPAAPRRKKRAVVNADTCLGCGVCVRQCRHDALSLQRLPARVYTPDSMMEKMMIQAVERGKLGDLLFDDPTSLTYRAGAALLNAVLSLPPAKLVLADEQIKSRFVRKLLDGFIRTGKGWAAKA